MTKKISLRESKQRYLEEYEKYKDVQLIADVPYCKKTRMITQRNWQKPHLKLKDQKRLKKKKI